MKIGLTVFKLSSDKNQRQFVPLDSETFAALG